MSKLLSFLEELYNFLGILKCLLTFNIVTEAKYSLAMKPGSPSHQEPVINGIARAVPSSSAQIPQTVNAIRVSSKNHLTPRAGHPITENGGVNPKMENTEM